jgi:hypothetical protein
LAINDNDRLLYYAVKSNKPPQNAKRAPKDAASPVMDAKTGAAHYANLRDDRDLSIDQVRAEFAKLEGLPKSVIDEISRSVGYTPEGSKAATLRRLQVNLEDMKMHQLRAKDVGSGA